MWPQQNKATHTCLQQNAKLYTNPHIDPKKLPHTPATTLALPTPHTPLIDTQQPTKQVQPTKTINAPTPPLSSHNVNNSWLWQHYDLSHNYA